jgi:2-hydroxy-3-keto-5-methylthiopentenyl-1-phosphate phosphatase
MKIDSTFPIARYSRQKTKQMVIAIDGPKDLSPDLSADDKRAQREKVEVCKPPNLSLDFEAFAQAFKIDERFDPIVSGSWHQDG